MIALDQQTRQQICDLVHTCDGYWELRGVPGASREEMRLHRSLSGEGTGAKVSPGYVAPVSWSLVHA